MQDRICRERSSFARGFRRRQGYGGQDGGQGAGRARQIGAARGAFVLSAVQSRPPSLGSFRHGGRAARCPCQNKANRADHKICNVIFVGSQLDVTIVTKITIITEITSSFFRERAGRGILVRRRARAVFREVSGIFTLFTWGGLFSAQISPISRRAKSMQLLVQVY